VLLVLLKELLKLQRTFWKRHHELKVLSRELKGLLELLKTGGVVEQLNVVDFPER